MQSLPLHERKLTMIETFKPYSEIPKTEVSLSANSPNDPLCIQLLCCQCLKGENYVQGMKTSLQRCGTCKSVWYCDKNCQTVAWKTHKIVCQSPEKKDRGLTLDQWRKLCGISTFYNEGEAYPSNHSLIPSEEEIVCKFYDETGSVRDLTQKKFREITGMTFTKGPLFPQKILIQLYEKEEIKPTKQLERFGSVALAKSENLGCELIATDSIPKGAVFAHWNGQMIENEEVNSLKYPMKARAYALHVEKNFYCCDPSVYAGLGAFANDGPPNCKYTISSKGQSLTTPKEIVLVATRDIKRGERIYLDYEKAHDIKSASYIISEEAFKGLVETCSKCKLNEKDDHQISNLNYILHTPHALALLFLEGVFDKYPSFAKEIRRLIKSSEDFYAADQILSALSIINVKDRQAFAKILPTFSQRSLKFLSAYLNSFCADGFEKAPSVDQCQAMGKVLDEMLVLLYGTLNGNYWFGSKPERDNFAKQFNSKENQNKLKGFTDGKLKTFSDGTMIPPLSPSFFDYVSRLAISHKKECVELSKRGI
jgi:MYND finger